MRQTITMAMIALMTAVACAEGDGATSDAGSDSVRRPAPGCETGFEPQADPRCGPVPEEYKHGCGCTDGVPLALCVDGKWQCERDLQPRAQCVACPGLPPRQ